MKLILVISFGLLLPIFTDANPKADFWKVPRHGANSFNNIPLEERFVAAKKAGLEFLRITPSKWLNGRPKSELGDFLLGRPGSFSKIIETDVQYLLKALDMAERAKLKIVLTVLSLPGNRWSQHNGGIQERKIWSDFKYHDLAATFWSALAVRLKGHPAIVAYNVKNEPTPELGSKKFPDWFTGDYQDWYASVKGTPQDLNLFYQKVIAAIRSVDSETPIMIDSGFYGTPWAFKVLEPVMDRNILYSFHMYEPYAYSRYKGNKQFVYPGAIPVGEQSPKVLNWNEGALSDFLNPVRQWAKNHNVSSSQIICGEFGLNRFQTGAEIFLDDQYKIYFGEKWHSAFYAFREDDGGHAMDYELGTQKPGWEYWKAVEKGKMPGPKTYKRKSKTWDVIQKWLNH